MSKKNELTYEKAHYSLQKLVTEIEQGDVPLDLLAGKVKEAKDLVEFCTNRLRNIESDVKKISGDE